MKKRIKIIEKAQQGVADKLNLARINQIVKVLVDEFDPNTGYFIGRDEYNSPNVDFFIEINDNNNIECGKFYSVKITNYENRIFKGEIV